MDRVTTIIADHRECLSSCFRALKNNPTVNLKIQTLFVGDYETESFIFERKTLSDLAQSIIDGRLFNQMKRLLSKRKRIAFLIEGLPEEIGLHGVSRSALQGAIITLTLIYGISVFYTLTAEETAQIIVFTMQQQHAIRKERVFRSGYTPKTKIKRQLYILQGLPGIGALRAKLLLAHFGSVRAIFSAEIERLIQVDGIGKHTAKTIYQILG